MEEVYTQDPSTSPEYKFELAPKNGDVFAVPVEDNRRSAGSRRRLRKVPWLTDGIRSATGVLELMNNRTDEGISSSSLRENGICNPVFPVANPDP
jgi:hypothetical protein